jgi:hypothetical protein
MKYVVGMGSGNMIYILSFIKVGSGIQKLIFGADSQTQRQHGDCISLLLFFFKIRALWAGFEVSNPLFSQAGSGIPGRNNH